jgi:hypothetical protein
VKGMRSETVYVVDGLSTADTPMCVSVVTSLAIQNKHKTLCFDETGDFYRQMMLKMKKPTIWYHTLQV